MGLTARVLAIDAGNSKTDVAVVADDGTVLATARGSGFRPPVVGVENAVDALAEAVDRAFAAAGVSGVDQVSACLANADFPVEEEQLAAALHARAWGSAVQVRNDTFAILRAGITEPRGVAVVCGAGINCVGMHPDGRTARFPAIGRISGDWGGGWGLAEEALWFAARAEDGRGEPTALARTLPAHFGLDTMLALIEALHLEKVEPARRHELTPVLFATAADGDPVARAVVDRLADEVVTMATVALTRLGLLEEETPVLLGGGVLAAQHPQLNDGVRDLLAARAPKAVPRVVTASPVLGAALLGLDRLDAPREVHERVRAHFEA
ncbi:ATPase [Streptomyces spinosirectus]|uniref:N-acetylglucosamine kinase n=1 Tax=Streptomyces TaxID=1883 RepID=UPI000D35F9FC|nr:MULTISPECIES: BadF/BadG/BcrA/BcrD ATPase family protein [Streptomyces]MBY8345001.1 ATPase [Streptomyces plumbidurans]PTM88315.1 N-acetylglucosamine kinase-like BadF-type ATPase [Streptomyces sp. VMFN-G11Ma]UIR18243.1 ATPase [Streptomyces spinosirectus]